jgi:DNA-binding transcriptional LysR family regulator
MFTAGELDVVFQYDNGVRSLSPSRVVGHDRTVLAAAASHPLARLRTVPVDQLLRYEFLVAEPGCTAEMLVDRFGRDLLGEARSGMVTGSLGALIRLTAHGRGITLLPEQAVARELASGELVELELAEAVRPVSIMARWWHPRQGMAERPLRALLELAHRADPYPAATAAATTSAAGQAS